MGRACSTCGEQEFLWDFGGKERDLSRWKGDIKLYLRETGLIATSFGTFRFHKMLGSFK
jgi:hypothetical protein